MMERMRYFIEPFDVLFLRGNKLFGDPGSFGESLIPPWPSVAAGALRSALLAARGYDASAFARGEIADDSELGTPHAPGTFTLTGFSLARRHAGANGGRIETLHPIPADLVLREDDGGGSFIAQRVAPRAAANGIMSSARTPSLAVLAEPERGKQALGQWLNAEGWSVHLSGREIDTKRHLVPSAELWTLDTRIGIALEPKRRAAATGALFTSQAVALRKREHAPPVRDQNGDTQSFDIGFLAEVAGAALPDVLTLRFGGDGRAALARWDASVTAPEPCYDAIARDGRCRMILTTPGLFARGWLPTGATDGDDGSAFDLGGITGRVVCAAVPRAEVVSGFDLAKRRPKPAQRVAPSGSVYWLDRLCGSPQALRKLAERGLWSEPVENDARRAEGFNRFTFAEWRD